jgi:hypothetical protein
MRMPNAVAGLLIAALAVAPGHGEEDFEALSNVFRSGDSCDIGPAIGKRRRETPASAEE